MKQIIPEIYEIPVKLSGSFWATRAYLLVNKARRRLLLIDTGSARSEWPIIQAIQQLGYQPTDLEGILITHWHEDHTGSLGAIMRATDNQAQVLVPPAEIEIIQSQQPHVIPSWGLVGQYLTLHQPAGVLEPGQLSQLKPLTVESPLLQTWNLQVIDTPGHTYGHVSIYAPNQRALFAGDALVCYNRVAGTFPHDDVALTEETAQKLLALDFDWLLPGHVHAMPYQFNLSNRQPLSQPPSFIWSLLKKTFKINPMAYSSGLALFPEEPRESIKPKILGILLGLALVWILISRLKKRI